MSPNPLRTFHYHACAHAFSAHFTRPFDELIEVQAASALPITGGHGNARVENFQFREFISFKKGYTHVSGALQPDDKSNNTLVTSAVEGLNLLDIVTADQIVARVYSKHRENAKEAEFTIVGSKFENLRIAGCDVKLELDMAPLEKVPTFQDALKDFDNKGDFFKIAHDPFKTEQSIKKPDPYGAFLCSCVKEMSTTCPGVTRVGHRFEIPGFGKLYLGEVLIKHGERIVTMIRFELGSSVSGSGSGISGGSNGQFWP